MQGREREPRTVSVFLPLIAEAFFDCICTILDGAVQIRGEGEERRGEEKLAIYLEGEATVASLEVVRVGDGI
jgi:hypothetical protein